MATPSMERPTYLPNGRIFRSFMEPTDHPTSSDGDERDAARNVALPVALTLKTFVDADDTIAPIFWG